MTKPRTYATRPGGPGRKRKPEVVIAVVVLLVVAACLGAVAAFGDQLGADAQPADGTTAVAGAAPSPEGSAWATATDAEANPSSAPSPTADPSPSSAATAAARSGDSGASEDGSGTSGSSDATNSGAGGGSGGSSGEDSGSSSGGDSGGSSGGGSGGNSGGSSGGSGTTTPKPSRSPTPAALTCTLNIDAQTAGLGPVMRTRTVTFKKGATVFDVLQRECRDAGIHLEFEYTPMYESAYIEGIDNLYEFDRGELSGWMYSVNGWFPNYGCSKYKLKDGDEIRWRYTCDLGKDIGGSNVLD
jgi:hypothetical protein